MDGVPKLIFWLVKTNFKISDFKSLWIFIKTELYKHEYFHNTKIIYVEKPTNYVQINPCLNFLCFLDNPCLTCKNDIYYLTNIDKFYVEYKDIELLKKVNKIENGRTYKITHSPPLIDDCSILINIEKVDYVPYLEPFFIKDISKLIAEYL